MSEINWSAITITDNYMFQTVFSDPELCKELLERVLHIEIDHVEVLDAERSLIPEPRAHGIRMDVYIADGHGTIYDVEVQKYDSDDLVKRSRYYLSANDMDCIVAGQDYHSMRNSFVIFICMFDPIKHGLPRYTITTFCRETDSEVFDGTTRVFVNPTAWERCSDPRLRPFLKYLEENTMEDDGFCIRVDEAVRRVRDRPEWRQNRMKWECALMDERRIGRAEGRTEGKAEGRAERQSLIAQLKDAMVGDGRTEEFLDAVGDASRVDALLSEYHIEWHDQKQAT